MPMMLIANVILAANDSAASSTGHFSGWALFYCIVYSLVVAVVVWIWRRQLTKKIELLELENLRREKELGHRMEVEKQRWMEEMQQQMKEEKKTEAQPVLIDNQEFMAQMEKSNLVTFIKSQVANYVVTSNKHLRYVFETSSERLIVSYDTEQMSKALTILYKNSEMFAPNNSDVLTKVSRRERWAVVQVINGGLGVPEYAKEHIFEPMGDGNDIGLSTMRDIVNAHGGTVRYEDKPGGGAMFIIELPTTSY